MRQSRSGDATEGADRGIWSKKIDWEVIASARLRHPNRSQATRVVVNVA